MLSGFLATVCAVEAASPIVLLLPPQRQHNQGGLGDCSATQAALLAALALHPELLPALKAAERLRKQRPNSPSAADKATEQNQRTGSMKKDAL